LKNAINTERFEEVFEEKLLRKGFALFQNKKLDFERRINGEYHFVFGGKKHVELTFRKKGKYISEYKCSCNNKKPCEHLCATIFFLQPELADKISDKSGARKENINPVKKLYKNYSTVIKQLLNTEDKTRVSGIISSIKKASKNNRHRLYYLLLAAIDNVPEWGLNSEQSAAILTELLTQFQKLNFKQLNSEQKSYLVFITHNSLSSSKRFNTLTFARLIPYVVSIAGLADLNEFKQQLGKRKLRYSYPSRLDLKLVAYLQIVLAEEKHIARKISSDYGQTSEFFLALAELNFSKRKTTSGFNSLNKGFLILKKAKPANYISYLEYCASKAREYNKSETELYYIKQIIIDDFLLSPNLLLRIKELTNPVERGTFVNAILKELRHSSKNNFDKISSLLHSEGRWDELITEISKQKNKFHLLNAVAIKKFPGVDQTLMNIYAKQFQAAVNEAAETHYQKHIFDQARKYIDLLIAPEKQKLLNMLLNVVGKHSYVRTYILKCYPLLS